MSLIIENAVKPTQKIFWKWIIFAFVVTCLLVGLFLGIQSVMQEEEVIIEEPYVETSVLDGILLTSFAIENPNNAQESTVVTTLTSVATGEVLELPSVQFGTTHERIFQMSVSADASKAVYLGIPLAEEGVDSGASEFVGTSLYSFDLSNVPDVPSLVTVLTTTSQVHSSPDTADYFRQFPVVSNYGQVLYSSISRSVYDEALGNIVSLDAESWDIYLLDDDGKKIVTKGLRPKWIHEDSFAFLKNDGVYVYNIKTNTEQLVWAIQDRVTVINGFDISNDTFTFTVTNPVTSTVDIATIADWSAPTSVTKLHHFDAVATNPVFSPDGEHIAFLVSRADIVDGTEVKILEIAYYSFERHDFIEQKGIIDTSYITGTYLSDWR